MPSIDSNVARSARPTLAMRLAVVLAAWLAALLLVMTILSVFKHQLATLPLAVRALVISGPQVVVMSLFVMPALNEAAARWARARQEE
jgi:antibiotic biosynthesis monooxygenase (ABM) superfamily enzyme